MNLELWAHRWTHTLFFINHNRFIVYLINGNFLLQYTIYYISFPVLVLHLVLTIFQRPIASFFLESGCKITAFSRHDQISWKIFWIFFVTNWFSVPIFFGVAIRTSFSISQNTPSFFAKADAKVLLFYDITKSLHDYLVNRDTLQKR